MTLNRTLSLLFTLLPFSTFAALTVHMQAVHEICEYGNGQLTAAAVGGTPPYTYIWSTGANTPTINGLGAGIYSVLVSDALGEEVTAQAEILSTEYELIAGTSMLPWCTAPRHVFEDPMASGVPNTWTVNGMQTEPFVWGPPSVMFYTSPWETEFIYTVDDGNGCMGTVYGSNGVQIADWPEINVVSVEPSCMSDQLGAIHLHVDGTFPSDLWYQPYITLLEGPSAIMGGSAAVTDVDGNASFTNLAPGAYALRWWMGVTAEGLGGPCAWDTIWVSVPELSDACGYVSGRSFIDQDGDCQMDAGEIGVPYTPLEVQPGNEVVLTNHNGRFTIPLMNGTYTLDQLDPLLEHTCSPVLPVSFTVNGDQQVINLANTSNHPPDLQASISGGVFRPGFPSYYAIQVRNNAVLTSGAVTVSLEVDPAMQLGDIFPVPTLVSGNVLTWERPGLGAFATFSAHVGVLVPPTTALGTELVATVEVSNTLTDLVPENDIAIETSTVVGSYDPNDKRAVTSSRASETSYFIDSDEWIDYTIRFQNTGTYLAEFVVITDTLPAELDMLTFQQGVASHPFTAMFKPGRVVEWRFDGIMLPDSTTDETGSHGMVKFRIRPRQPLMPGTVIENIANIYFDFNEPVITEPSVLVVTTSTGVVEGRDEGLHVYPNPAQDLLHLQWTGPAPLSGAWQVFSTDGRLVLQGRLEHDRTVVPLAGLSAGHYIIRSLTTDDPFTRPFTKTH